MAKIQYSQHYHWKSLKLPKCKVRCSHYGGSMGTEMRKEQKTHISCLTLTSGHRSIRCGGRWRSEITLFKLLFLSPLPLLFCLVYIVEFALLSALLTNLYQEEAKSLASQNNQELTLMPKCDSDHKQQKGKKMV